MDTLLFGLVAIVTGGGQNPKGMPGFGTAISKRLAACGATVLILDRVLAFAEHTANEINAAGGKAFAYQIDISNVAEVQALFSRLIQEHGSLDILVNNAGICRETPFLEVREAEFDQITDVNAKGTFFASQAALRLMSERCPSRMLVIIIIGSDAARKGAYVASAPYSMSKAAVVNLVYCIMRQGKQHRVRAVGILPGPGKTEMTAGWPAERLGPLMSQFKMVEPDLVSPAQIAKAVVFAADPEMLHLNGTLIDVSCGTFPA